MSYKETPLRTPSSGALVPSSSSSSTAPNRSLNKQIILDEDEYTAGLDYIIRRDFFPSLAPLEATNSYLSALESRDPALIQASVRRLAELEKATPTPRTRGRSMGSTPYVNWPSDTPLRTPSTSTTSQKKLPFDPSLSLDAFQAKYTSEDNASFTEILDDENMKRRDKHAWAWNAQDRAMLKRKREVEGRERLLIEALAKSGFDDQSTEGVEVRKKLERGDIPLLLENGQTNERAKMEKGKAKEGTAEAEAEEEEEVMRELVESDEEVDGQALTVTKPEKGKTEGQLIIRKAERPSNTLPVDVMAPQKDTRSTAIPAWAFKTRNSLMFLPDANESPYHQPSQVASSSEASDKKNRGPPKTIIHANTRLPSQSEPSEDSSQPPSPTRSRIAAAISGTPYHPASDSPKIRGYGFVDELPTPKPEDMEPEQIKQLMTWGTIMSTPRVLSTDDGEPAGMPVDSPFVIKPPNARDALARKLGGEAGRSLAKKAGLLNGTSVRTPASSSSSRIIGTPKRTDMLTPAARRLLDRTRGGGATPGGLLGRTPSNLKSSLSSTPGRNMDSKRRKELDLRKVGWSPRDTPRLSG
ncbi:hypothetical protein FRC02_008429 [Tulasnella sp. 418]|nr:hypothetical protein FRC02_008429 [Tulasnella sp. 418]